MKNKINSDYFRNFIFGAEDALVSTAGVLFGISSAQGYTVKQILLTGLVVITVEALSMGAGSYLTEESVHAIEGKKNHKDNTIIGGIIMFFSYFITGLLILLPYLLLPIVTAKITSIIIAVLILFILGILPKRKLKDAFRMVFVAGLAILIGYLVANFVENI